MIKIGYPNQRKFNMIGFNRQWSKTFKRIPFQPLSTKEQEENFSNQMEKIKMILNIETIILGDFVNYICRARTLIKYNNTKYEVFVCGNEFNMGLKNPYIVHVFSAYKYLDMPLC